MGDEQGATFLHFDEIEWVDETKAGAPPELVEEAKRLGARRKRLASGEGGFHLQHSVMPAGYTVPLHSHDHDELIVVVEGGCTMLDGGPTLQANDAVTFPAGARYGFTCGDAGMRFLTIRTGASKVSL